jgi:hypothetical protein
MIGLKTPKKLLKKIKVKFTRKITQISLRNIPEKGISRKPFLKT